MTVKKGVSSWFNINIGEKWCLILAADPGFWEGEAAKIFARLRRWHRGTLFK